MNTIKKSACSDRYNEIKRHIWYYIIKKKPGKKLVNRGNLSIQNAALIFCKLLECVNKKQSGRSSMKCVNYSDAAYNVLAFPFVPFHCT